MPIKTEIMADRVATVDGHVYEINLSRNGFAVAIAPARRLTLHCRRSSSAVLMAWVSPCKYGWFTKATKLHEAACRELLSKTGSQRRPSVPQNSAHVEVRKTSSFRSKKTKTHC